MLGCLGLTLGRAVPLLGALAGRVEGICVFECLRLLLWNSELGIGRLKGLGCFRIRGCWLFHFRCRRCFRRPLLRVGSVNPLNPKPSQP